MLNVLELFGGIGAPRKALTNLGIDFKVVDYVEIDKYAVKSYNAMYNENYEPQDICNWDKDINVDMIIHGSPCQSFSLAGLQQGGDKDSGTASSLMYESVRIIQKLKPKYVVWENVKNMLSKKHRHNFDNYLQEMKSLGYKNYYKVLNAKDYDTPQNRERVFTISILNNGIFEFPAGYELKTKLIDLLENEVDEKYYLDKEKQENIIYKENPKGLQIADLHYYNYDSNNRVYGTDKLATTLRAKEPNGYILIKNATKQGYLIATNGDGIDFNYPTSKLRRGRVQKESCQTLTTSASLGVYIDNNLRKFTPKECWRLMGFTDEDYEKASAVNSNAQLYKQAGNSIVVNVLQAIFKELLKGE